ncbi:MAG: hypothetical protein ACI9AQ_002931, partial [Dinoroseobacter sp.]
MWGLSDGRRTSLAGNILGQHLFILFTDTLH